MYGPQTEHPQTIMKALGITYQHATPQSIGDQWWFWNCENIPLTLPGYITELRVYLDTNDNMGDYLDPMKCIGFGLSREDAEKIRDYKSVGK